jgi:hypothetical protein
MTRTKSNRSENTPAMSHQGATVSKEAAWIRKAGTSKNVSLGRQNASKKRHPAVSLEPTVSVPRRSLIQPKNPAKGCNPGSILAISSAHGAGNDPAFWPAPDSLAVRWGGWIGNSGTAQETGVGST